MDTCFANALLGAKSRDVRLIMSDIRDVCHAALPASVVRALSLYWIIREQMRGSSLEVVS